jgi:hypothetical protein
MIARRLSIPEIVEIPDYPGVSTICRWQGADIARMMKSRQYRMSVRQNMGHRERRNPHVSRGK